MKTYAIQNARGEDLGIYQAASAREAVDKMAQSQGWDDYAAACHDNTCPPDYEPAPRSPDGFEHSRSFGSPQVRVISGS